MGFRQRVSLIYTKFFKISFILFRNLINLEFSNENHGLVDAVIFKELLCKLIYETKFQLPYKKASKEEDYLIYCEPISFPFDKSQAYFEESKENVKNKENPIDFINLSKLLSSLTEEKGILLCNAGGLYSMDANDNYQLINQSILLALRDLGDFKYQMEVYTSEKQVLYSKSITTELNYHIDVENNLLKWVNYSEKGLELLAIRFDAYNVTKTLKFLMNKCSFEAARKEYLHDVIKKEDQDFTNNYFAQEKMELEPIVEQEFEKDPEYVSIEGNFVSFRANPGEKTADFTGFAQARMLDRAFLTKGEIISVYRTEHDGHEEIEHLLDLPIMSNFEKSHLTPKKILMHEQDTKMLMLDEKDEKKVYYVDVEKGKVIQELQADEYNRITDISSGSKQASLTQNPVFLGINERNIFKLDPRLKASEASVAKKIYNQTNHFQAIATNMYGNFVLGNQAGEIRLYKDVGQNAKNLYPGLGDPILSIDCTKDGRFILATCKNYLILLPVCFENKNGFQQTLKNVEKATPRVLKLQPKTLVNFAIKEVNFKSGKFDESENIKEKYIVASSEEFIVTWTLKNVLEGKVLKYEVKKLDDKIITNEFKYNNDEKLMVVMPKEIRVQRTHKVNNHNKEEEKE